LRSLLVVAAMAFVLVPATRASAHASLLATTPAAGYSVATSPPALTLVFDQPVSVRGTPLRLDGPGGAVELGAARLSNGDRWLTAAVPRPLARGQYAVTWQVVAEDGDVVGGSYSFAVGSAAAVSSHATQTRGLPAAAVLRWLLFAALSIGLGGLAGQWVAARVIRKAAAVGRQLAPVRAPVAAATAVGALAALGLSAHVLGGGDVVAGLTHPSIHALLATSAGRVSGVEVAAFALAAVLATRPRLQAAAALPLLAVVVAEGRRSHLHEIGGGAGLGLLVVHLAAAAVWVGALWHVVTVAWRWRGHRAAAHRVLAEYGRLALALLLLVTVTGTVSAIVALPRASALVTSGYGRLLVAKIALVVAVVGCALAARWRVRLSSPLRPDGAVAGPGRAARAERLLLAGVLAVTAVLVSVAVPGAAQTVALPPPPTGPVVRLATLDGEVTVAVTASDGRLDLRTSVPAPSGNAADMRTEVSARVGARPVALRRCGPSCFVGPVQWARGTNSLTVTASSRTWAGGTAALRVPWPPVDDSRALAQVLAAMRAVPKVIVHESVTSNTSGPAPIVDTHALTGPDFVSVEPYSSAGTLPVTVIGSTELAFAMLDQGYYFRLDVGRDHRITGEVITTPEHLYTRTFDYPGR
jgi:copper transport protein